MVVIALVAHLRIEDLVLAHVVFCIWEFEFSCVLLFYLYFCLLIYLKLFFTESVRLKIRRMILETDPNI